MVADAVVKVLGGGDLEQMAVQAQLAYDCPDVEICNTGISYCRDGRDVYVGISGSDDLSDWIANARAIPWSGIHAGILGRYVDIRDAIENVSSGSRRVFWSGHSQGGALAQLAGRDCGYVASFGSPKLFSRWVLPKIRHVRFYAEDDPVPMLPGRVLYRHVGIGVPLGVDGLLVDPSEHRMHEYLEKIARYISVKTET